ncbi:MAG: DUF418 domain-containing protein [Chitinophagaceae bacterium]|nr:DUF418 domain-containing protein [Chitinophagaceae bacterium]
MNEYSASLSPQDLPGDKSIAANQTVKPVSTTDRIKTVDMVRGFALLGILLMNIPGFGIDWSEIQKVITGPREGKDFYTAAVIFTFFDGTMRGLFSMLFGAGMVLFMMNKKESPIGPTVADYYYRRLLWLVLFGLFNAYVLLWSGDILFFYGLCGMLLFSFRKIKPVWLIAIGFACICIGMLKTQFWYDELRGKRKAYTEAIVAEKSKKELTPEQQGARAEWVEMEKNQKPDTANVNRNLRKMHSGYTTVWTHLLPHNVNAEVNYMYHGLWDMLCMMFIGMALLGLGFFSNKFSTSTYLMILLVGYGIGIPLGWTFFNGLIGWNTSFGSYVDEFRAPHFQLYDFRRVFLCIGHASVLMLIYRSKIVPWLMRALANVGQMAFTNYLVQSIICTWFFFGYGFDNYNRLRLHQLYYVVFAVWIFQLIASTIWLKYFRFGPFEWLWRSLTYWKRQPMKL